MFPSSHRLQYLGLSVTLSWWTPEITPAPPMALPWDGSTGAGSRRCRLCLILDPGAGCIDGVMSVVGVVALVHDPPADFPIVADCTGGSDKNGPPREPPCICTP